MLDVPYGTQVDGATWHPAVKMHLYVGRALPAHLAPYSPGPYTLGRFIENTLNPDDPTPSPEPTDELEPSDDPEATGGARAGARPEPVGERLDLERAIALLPPGARTAFVLHDVEGYTHEEIARVTGTATATVRSQLHRARRLLMERLDR